MPPPKSKAQKALEQKEKDSKKVTPAKTDDKTKVADDKAKPDDKKNKGKGKK